MSKSIPINVKLRDLTAMQIHPVSKLLGLTAALVTSASVQSGDWPQWGRTPSKNFQSPAKGLPTEFEAGAFKPGPDDVDSAPT